MLLVRVDHGVWMLLLSGCEKVNFEESGGHGSWSLEPGEARRVHRHDRPVKLKHCCASP